MTDDIIINNYNKFKRKLRGPVIVFDFYLIDFMKILMIAIVMYIIYGLNYSKVIIGGCILILILILILSIKYNYLIFLNNYL